MGINQSKNTDTICTNIINLYTLPPDVESIINGIIDANLSNNVIDNRLIPSFIKHYAVGFNKFHTLNMQKAIQKAVLNIYKKKDRDIIYIILGDIQRDIIKLYKLYRNNIVRQTNRENMKKMVLDILYSNNMIEIIKRIS